MKVINYVIKLNTATSLDFIDITDKVRKKVKQSGIKNGMVNIQSLHTTMAIVVQEAEPLLIGDLKKTLEKVSPRTSKYMHDDFERRTINMHPNEPVNGHSHCKALFLPSCVSINIVKADLDIGQWQRIFAVELDDARLRKISVQIIGC
jgi:secondary thiamine-phosphate synthase enzyme